MPAGVVEWGTTPKDFFEKKAAMMWTTTGNLTNIRGNAEFPFGVAMLPAKKHRGSPTGGGNFYVFAKTTPAEQQAALQVLEVGDRAAARGAVEHRHRLRRGDAGGLGHAGDEEVRAGRAAGAVARDQLQYSVAELSTHDNQRVTKALNNGLQAALTGSKPPADAMRDAQREATRHR